MNVRQIIETWEDDGFYRDWYVVESVKQGGEPHPIYIAEYEQASRFAARLITGVDAVESLGTYNMPFYRLRMVDKAEALELFKLKAGDDDDDEVIIKTWTTAAEAADILGITKSRVYALARSGVLESREYEGHKLISHASILARLKSNPGPGRPWN